jgi:long-subunit acyl-CoA synthetase (AMP-forming)
MSAKYMSPTGRPLAPGEVGELWLQGPNVFRGYWNNAAATKDALTPDGYFKTGDIGFQDQQHNFYITDRVKELIKYNGFQVAPAELEGKLMQSPLVDDVAVIGVEDEVQHTEVPRAYIVASQEKAGEREAKDIVEWMHAKVANHKVCHIYEVFLVFGNKLLYVLIAYFTLFLETPWRCCLYRCDSKEREREDFTALVEGEE